MEDKLKGFKGAIFDMDGLLIDSERYSIEVFKGIFFELGFEFDPAILKKTMGANLNEGKKVMMEVFKSEDLVDKFYQMHKEKLFSAYKDHKIPLKKGVSELIGWLKSHDIPCGLATSSPIEAVRLALDEKDVSVSDFKAIITGDEVSKCKPDPEIFLKAADRIGVDIKDCLVFEDSLNGIRAALASRATAILVIDMYQPTIEIREEVGNVFNSLSEVLDKIKASNEED